MTVQTTTATTVRRTKRRGSTWPRVENNLTRPHALLTDDSLSVNNALIQLRSNAIRSAVGRSSGLSMQAQLKPCHFSKIVKRTQHFTDSTLSQRGSPDKSSKERKILPNMHLSRMSGNEGPQAKRPAGTKTTLASIRTQIQQQKKESHFPNVENSIRTR